VIDLAEYARRVDSERGVGTFRSRLGPGLYPCCWTDCDAPARRETLFATPPDESDNIRFYFFCSSRHRVLWVNSPKDMNNLPVGFRGLIS
jgi:hypothetical protein